MMALAALVALGLSVRSANAQTATTTAAEPIEPGIWTLTPSAAMAFGGDLEDGGLGLGLAAGYNFTPRVAFEAAFNIHPSVEQGLLLNVDTTVWNLTGNVLYHFAERPWMPYGAIGFGIGRADTDLDEADPALVALGLDESSTELIMNFGGGVKRRFNERASFRGDIRYFTGDDLVADFFRIYAGVSFDLNRR
jgi:opacity protein-like surface antigen